MEKLCSVPSGAIIRPGTVIPARAGCTVTVEMLSAMANMT